MSGLLQSSQLREIGFDNNLNEHANPHLRHFLNNAKPQGPSSFRSAYAYGIGAILEYVITYL